MRDAQVRVHASIWLDSFSTLVLPSRRAEAPRRGRSPNRGRERCNAKTCPVTRATNTRNSVDPTRLMCSSWVSNATGTTGLAFVCSERSECVEAECVLPKSDPIPLWSEAVSTSERSGMTVVSEPSDEMVAAAATPCDERLRLLDENCRMFAGDACPVDEGCRVETGQVLDPERGCATGETYTECLGVTILAPPEMVEFLPCD